MVAVRSDVAQRRRRAVAEPRAGPREHAGRGPGTRPALVGRPLALPLASAPDQGQRAVGPLLKLSCALAAAVAVAEQPGPVASNADRQGTAGQGHKPWSCCGMCFRLGPRKPGAGCHRRTGGGVEHIYRDVGVAVAADQMEPGGGGDDIVGVVA